MTRVPEPRADPCHLCGGDHTEPTCMVRRDHMGWTKNYVEEIDEAIVEILKDKYRELELDSFFDSPDRLEDLVHPYYWMVDYLGDDVASQIARDAEQTILERMIP